MTDQPYTPKRTESLLQELMDATLTHLLEKLKAKTATAAEIAQARELLRDGGIQVLPKAAKVQSAKALLQFPTSSENDEDCPPHLRHK